MNHQVFCIYPDTVHSKVYATGEFNHAGGVFADQVAVYDGQTWSPLGSGWGCYPNSVGNAPNSIVERDGELLFGGGDAFCALNYDHSRFHKFDGQNWNIAGYSNNILNLRWAGGELFALGPFDTLDTRRVINLGRWNGSYWEQFGDTTWLHKIYQIAKVIQYQGDFYFGGNLNYEPGRQEEVIRWDGDSFESLDGGIKGDSWVNTLAEYQGKLWVGGLFEQATGNVGQCIMTWDGQQWENPFTGVHYPVQVYDMAVMDGVLYLAGLHYVLEDGTWKGPRWLAKYDGQDFCSFGGEDFYGIDVEPWGSRLLVRCNQVNSPYPDTLRFLAEWVGGDQVDFCAPQGPQTAATGPQSPAPLFAQVVPNPAKGQAELHFALSKPADINVTLSDLLGRTLQAHALGRTGAGTTRLPLALDGLAKGVYLCRVEAGEQSVVLRVVVE
jgi:Secretion system C-terminal sorting domain